MQVNLSTQIGECENQSWLLLLPREGGCLAVVLGRKVEVYFGLMNRSGPAWVKVGQIETCPAISQVREGEGVQRAGCLLLKSHAGQGNPAPRGAAEEGQESGKSDFGKNCKKLPKCDAKCCHKLTNLEHFRRASICTRSS